MLPPPWCTFMMFLISYGFLLFAFINLLVLEERRRRKKTEKKKTTFFKQQLKKNTSLFILFLYLSINTIISSHHTNNNKILIHLLPVVDIWRRKYIIYTNNIQSIINKKKNCIIFYIRIDHTVSVKKVLILMMIF